MLTIRQAALAADLDMARARMESANDVHVSNAEWSDLLPEQQATFMQLAIVNKDIADETTI